MKLDRTNRPVPVTPPLIGGVGDSIKEKERPNKTRPNGKWILISFAVVMVFVAIANATYYWTLLRMRGDLILWGFNLLMFMFGGMFVQVLSANYRSGRALFKVSACELIYPMLFSPIVFYPVWALTGTGSQTMFSYYAAFLNGYFWQAIVSTARVQPIESVK